MNLLSVSSPHAQGAGRGCAGREESGQSLIEAALAIPLLLLVAFNAINFGWFFYVAVNLAGAPRDAVEYSIMGFSTPGQLTLPSPGGTSSAPCTSSSVADLIYNDLVVQGQGNPCPGTASVQVCTMQAGINNAGGTNATTVCKQYGPGSVSYTPASDPEAPSFALNRVDVVYTVAPLIPANVFGLTLLPSYTFHRQVSMRAID
jgi:Flp pilus assembly protein TadG